VATHDEELLLKVVSGTAFRWFLVIELLCAGGFLAFLGLGDARLALVFLVGPLQVLAWLFALKDGSHLLALFAALLPAAGMALLPAPYHRYVYLPVTILLLLVATRRFLANDGGPGRDPLDKHDLVPLTLLATSLVLSTASAVFHGWTNENLWNQVVLLVEAMVLLYFSAVVPTTVREVRNIILAFCATLSAAMTVVLLSWALGVKWGPLLGGITSKGGFNVLGACLSCGAVLLLGALLQTDKAANRIIVLLCMAVVLSTLVLTKSRGAWLGFGAAVLYALLRVRSGWLWTAVVLGVLLLLGVGSLREILLARAGETSEGDPSFLGRVVLWVYAWKVIKANWLLGVGFDNFRYVKVFYGYPEPLWYTIRFHAHNILLEMLTDLGIFGLLGACWLYVRTLLRLDRVVRANNPDSWALALGLEAALVTFAAHGLVDFVVWQYGALSLLGVLLGLGISLSRLSQVERAQTRRVV
jgi:O-antigen ligase